MYMLMSVYAVAFWKEVLSRPGEQMLMGEIYLSKSLATICFKSAQRNGCLCLMTRGKLCRKGFFFFSFLSKI